MLVAHLFREVAAAIRFRLAPELSKPEDQEAVIAASGIVPDVKPLTNLRQQFNEDAHRRHLKPPRPFDKERRGDAEAADAKIHTIVLSLPEDLEGADMAMPAEQLLQRSRDRGTTEADVTETESKVLGSLIERIAPGPAAMYEDVLLLQQPVFAWLMSRAHLIGHLLREAESGFRDVVKRRNAIAPPQAQSDVPVKRHVLEVQSIIADYRVDEEIGRSWLEIAEKSFAGDAHRSALEMPLRFEGAIAERCDQVTNIFGSILDRFEHTFGKYVMEMDRLIDSKNVDPKAFRNSFPQTSLVYEYFFSRLEHPGWIAALRDHDSMKPPPDSTNGVFSLWPQGEYLQRAVLKSPAVAGDVAMILERATVSMNPFVHEWIARGAIHLSPPQRRAIAVKERDWLRRAGVVAWSCAEALGDLAVRLAEDGATEDALAILESMLQLDVVENDGRPVIVPRTFAYEHLVNVTVPKLSEVCGLRAFDLLVETIDAWRSFGFQSMIAPVDGSYLWRSAIEPHEQNAPHVSRYRDAAIDALRDLTVGMVRRGALSAEQAVSYLESRGWNVYRRIALHLLIEESEVDLLAARMTADTLIARDLWHEVWRALQAHFHSFSSDVRARIAGTILRGLDDRDGTPHWQRWQLARLPRPIPEELLSTANAVGASHEDDAEFLVSFTSDWKEPQSPRTIDQLTAMSFDEVIAFLRTWVPPSVYTIDGESRVALANELQKLVTARSVEISGAAEKLIGLDVAYVRSILDGLAAAASGELDWPRVLVFCEWVASRPRVAHDERVIHAEAEESSWMYARMAVISLLERAVALGTPALAGLRPITSILKTIASDPSPTSNDYDEATPETYVDFGLCTVRGKAIVLSMRIARLAVTKVPPSDVHDLVNIATPHSFIQHEPSPLVRAVAGYVFSDWWWLDEPSARAAAEEILEDEAVWNGYLAGKPCAEALEVLRHRYLAGVMSLETTDKKGSLRHQRLAAHIVHLYAEAAISLDDGPVVAFFERASPSLRAVALERLSHSPRRLLSRVQALWEWRTTHSMAPEEWAALESWILRGPFPSEWMLQQAARGAAHGLKLEHLSGVVEKVGTWLHDDPATVMSVIRQFVDRETDYRSLYIAKDALRKLVQVARGIEAAREDATTIAHIMTARKFANDFKDLL